MREFLGWTIFAVGCIAGAYGLAEQIRQLRAERALWRRLLEREPMANVTPPTTTELTRPNWSDEQ